MLEKTDRPDLFKDETSGVIVNTNINKLDAYKKQKKLLTEARKVDNKMDALQTQVYALKRELDELKNTVKILNAQRTEKI